MCELAAGPMSSLINFSSLEEVLKTVSEQQRAIFDTLEGMRAEVDTLALRTKLEEQENVLEDGCVASRVRVRVEVGVRAGVATAPARR